MEDILDLDLEGFSRAMRRIDVLVQWFRPTIEGIEHLKAVQGALIVSNHGALGMDLPVLISRIYKKTGRRLRTLGDHVVFATPGLRDLAWQMGIVEGTPENTHRLLTAGEIVLVYPGGAEEALCSAEERYRLFWEGRYGFVRTALRAGVPIVPLVGIGTDDIYLQPISRNRVRRSGVGRFIAEHIGEKYVLPWFLGLGLFPLPVHIHYLVGEPIDLGHGPASADDAEVVAALHARVKEATEVLIARGLAEGRGGPGPVVRRLQRLERT
jgi:1-acyl-sn-glycerol-3-phosphate acyltransferase